MVLPKKIHTSALFSDRIMVWLRSILESEYPGREISDQELIEAAIKLTSFVAIHELRKECHE